MLAGGPGRRNRQPLLHLRARGGGRHRRLHGEQACGSRAHEDRRPRLREARHPGERPQPPAYTRTAMVERVISHKPEIEDWFVERTPSRPDGDPARGRRGGGVALLRRRRLPERGDPAGGRRRRRPVGVRPPSAASAPPRPGPGRRRATSGSRPRRRPGPCRGYAVRGAARGTRRPPDAGGKVARVRMGSRRASFSPVSGSMVGNMHRSQFSAPSSSTSPMRRRHQWSSANGRAPSTTRLGRKRRMVAGSASRAFSSSREARPMTSTG